MDWHFLCGALYEKHPILGSQRRSRRRAPAPLRNTIFCRPEAEGAAENRVTHCTTLRGSDKPRKRRTATSRRTIKEGNTTEQGGDASSTSTNTSSSILSHPALNGSGIPQGRGLGYAFMAFQAAEFGS
jgi:hypothetical protein